MRRPAGSSLSGLRIALCIIALLLLGVAAAFGFATPAGPGGPGWAIYDIIVNKMLNGPVGVIVGVTNCLFAVQRMITHCDLPSAFFGFLGLWCIEGTRILRAFGALVV